MLAAFFLSFMAIGGLIPPQSPTASAEQITEYLVDNKMRIRWGLALTMLSAAIAIPFVATICMRVRRAEGGWRTLSATQIIAAAVFMPGFAFPLTILATAAFRPEQRDPQTTLAFSDFFWLCFIGVVGSLVVQCVVLAIASFIDSSTPRTFPRWFGYFNAWYAVLATPGGAIYLFNDGPLAWNGVIAFWIPMFAFGIWMIGVSVVLLQSIQAESQQAIHAVAA